MLLKAFCVEAEAQAVGGNGADGSRDDGAAAAPGGGTDWEAELSD